MAVVAQCTFNFTKCPAYYELQSDRVKADFDLNKMTGKFYELAFHDYTQYPSCPKPDCITADKAIDRNLNQINDTFTLGCFGKGYTVPLRFDITDTPGFFIGEQSVVKQIKFPDTVIDYKLSEDGSEYEWIIEFQCDEALGRILFTGINFYARHHDVTDEYYNEFIQAGRDRGIGVYMDAGFGLTKVAHPSTCWYNNVSAEVMEMPSDEIYEE